MKKNDKSFFNQACNAVALDKATLSAVEGGKTDSVTLRLVATVAPKFQAIRTANGIAVQSNIPSAAISTQEFGNGAIVTVTATWF